MKPRLNITLHDVGVRRGKRWVLKHIDLNLRAGERWALIGRNGAGKTQLLKLLSSEIWPTPTAEGWRRYRLGRSAIDEVDVKPLVAYLGAELQDKFARMGWDFPVRDIVAAGLQDTEILLSPVTREQQRMVASSLRDCGLLRLASRNLSSLSYGQKRLALLARTLVRKPHWLLLDELYNGLDERFRRKVDAILLRARRRGQSWMVAAHRVADIPRGTRRLLHLEAGRIVATRTLNARMRTLAALREPAAPASLSSGARRLAVPGAMPTLLQLSNASLYVDYRCVLRRLNWRVQHGEQWVVLGANGSGKSSLLRLLYGDLAPALGGVIERGGFERGTPIELWKQTVGYISPDLQSDYAIDVSILDLVASGRHASIGLNEAADAQDLRTANLWLGYFHLGAVAQRRPRELSYGQMRRALFARAMAVAPRLLLLDEPMTGLDTQQRHLMRELLSGLMARGITLVMAVHHAEDLPAGITHALHLHNRQARAIPFVSAN